MIGARVALILECLSIFWKGNGLDTLTCDRLDAAILLGGFHKFLPNPPIRLKINVALFISFGPVLSTPLGVARTELAVH